MAAAWLPIHHHFDIFTAHPQLGRARVWLRGLRRIACPLHPL